jgi:hypothetical protein
VTTHRGDHHLTAGVPAILARYEASGAVVEQSRLIVDREGMGACFLRDLTLAGYTVVTVLKTDQYAGIDSLSRPSSMGNSCIVSLMSGFGSWRLSTAPQKKGSG